MIPVNKRIDLLKIISHPFRSKILEGLTHDVKCVSDFEESLDIIQPKVFQHLSLLRVKGIIDLFVDGRLNSISANNPSSRISLKRSKNSLKTIFTHRHAVR